MIFPLKHPFTWNFPCLITGRYFGGDTQTLQSGFLRGSLLPTVGGPEYSDWNYAQASPRNHHVQWILTVNGDAHRFKQFKHQLPCTSWEGTWPILNFKSYPKSSRSYILGPIVFSNHPSNERDHPHSWQIFPEESDWAAHHMKDLKNWPWRVENILLARRWVGAKLGDPAHPKKSTLNDLDNYVGMGQNSW